jgi:hypothetical protein
MEGTARWMRRADAFAVRRPFPLVTVTKGSTNMARSDRRGPSASYESSSKLGSIGHATDSKEQCNTCARRCAVDKNLAKTYPV